MNYSQMVLPLEGSKTIIIKGGSDYLIDTTKSLLPNAELIRVQVLAKYFLKANQ